MSRIRKEWAKFRYTRQFGWERENICDEKIVYAVLDASMSLVIVINYLGDHQLKYMKGLVAFYQAALS